jgi:hypothetical protein
MTLLEAIREHARLTTGREVAEVLIRYDDGSEMRLSPAGASAAPTPGPTGPGWARQGDGFALDGRPVLLEGRPAEILGLLIDSGGSCDVGAIREQIWGNYPAEDGVIRTAIHRLRKQLRCLLDFPDDFDPIVANRSVYTLAKL